MNEVFDCNPADIVAGIGPSIHMHDYEVGPEVVAAVEESFKNSSAILKPSMNKGHAYFDLWEANRQQLLAYGVKPEHIEISGICTYHNNDDFFSARRQGIRSGRILSGILLGV